MKKFTLSISLLSLSILPLSTFSLNISDVNNVFTSIEFVKESINFENITINSKVPYNLVQWAIQKYCPSSAIDQATIELEQFKNIWISNISDPNKYLSDRFDTIKWLIANHEKDNEYKYCKDMYLLFSTLEITQNLYTWNIDSKTKKTERTEDSDIKKSSENSDQQSEDSQEKINFTFTHNTNWLPTNAKQSYLKSTELYLQEILANLVNSNILDENDLKIMNNKIEVTYTQSCDFTEWTFRALKNQDTGEYTFKDINLIIAYCNKDSSPERQRKHVQQILAHELWHYIYFFKDKNPSNFSKICRNNEMKACNYEDFVSDYSQESPEEDYAESFAYRYLYNRNRSVDVQYRDFQYIPLLEKFKYFKKIFG